MDKIIKHSKEYNRVHYYLRTKYGKANKCEFTETCNGVSNNYEWALKKGKNYSDNPNDYYQLCKSCHVKYDFKGVTDANKKRMSELGKLRKGKKPYNKGKYSKIDKECENCSKEMKIYKSQKTKFCSRKCRGEKQNNFKKNVK